MSQVFGTTEFRTSRKIHVCNECDRKIPKGVEYKYERSCYNGEDGFEWFEYKICSTCIKSLGVNNWLPSLVEWAKRNGAKVRSYDHSYYVGPHQVPDYGQKICAGDEQFVLAVVGNSQLYCLENFVEWLHDNDGINCLPELVIREFSLREGDSSG